jgi:hypothetical protein
MERDEAQRIADDVFHAGPTLTLAVREGARPEVAIVAALGGLALHRSHLSTGMWVISHRPSGLRVMMCTSRRDGLVALAALNQPGVEWERPEWTDQVACPPEHAAAVRRARAACLEGAW